MSTEAARVVISAVQTTTGSGTGTSLVYPGGNYAGAILHLNVSAASGTSPTLNVYIQDTLVPAAAADTVNNPPSGTAVFDDFAAFTQATAAGDWVIRASMTGASAGNVKADGSLTAATVRVGPIGMVWRVKWVIAGTSPSFTWSVTAQFIPF